MYPKPVFRESPSLPATARVFADTPIHAIFEATAWLEKAPSPLSSSTTRQTVAPSQQRLGSLCLRIKFERHNIDLKNKPKYFSNLYASINPDPAARAKVPLVIGSARIQDTFFDSAKS